MLSFELSYMFYALVYTSVCTAMHLWASFCSPPNATTVLIEERTSSAILPAEAYASCSRTVNDVMICNKLSGVYSNCELIKYKVYLCQNGTHH